MIVAVSIAVIVTGGIAAIALFLHDNRRTR